MSKANEMEPITLQDVLNIKGKMLMAQAIGFFAAMVIVLSFVCLQSMYLEIMSRLKRYKREVEIEKKFEFARSSLDQDKKLN